MFLKNTYQAVVATIFFTILLGLAYPLLMMAAGLLFAKDQATGSLVTYNGKIIGSTLIGQAMPVTLFQPRPSANNYNALSSGGSNLSINNEKQQAQVQKRIQWLKANYGSAPVPEDLVFASGSGLDPDISLASAYYQADYVAKRNGLPISLVTALINQFAQKHLFNPSTVNVLKLNLAVLKAFDEKR
ncbi:potassium-transporting ATPase subunit C [Facilibium subflavum]|uniref:potassium-transporting ATPase subunit C n=1 Tax=Facilibium subflavum TaxID=2219058 RepID=UPI000E64A78B|nr:potassium-transporting ATPase subunit C [Facilibium subflavum]